ncbi:hypothetical protein PGLA_11815 [Paenibacillus glacialis]|uniref:Uncharacterized protein n=1 Tax=Paenibacillus glacialis TaxID=494026 RepID=A0A168KR64_9BACL|nr:hypothetical protein PGLA_11815 [Paenibacillus glacialis]
MYPLGLGPLHISFYGHYSYYTMPQWGTDPSSKWIQDNLNIHISGISADGNAKLTLRKMIVNKQLPDIADGRIYYFPNYYTNRPYGNAGYVLNKKIYRRLAI